MSRRSAVVSAVAACSAMVMFPATVFANDNCATPTVISGAGVFPFDLTSATASQVGNVSQCLPNFDFLGKDVWFCWTADCTGLVTITTCGLTSGDTVLAIYDTGTAGCACPQGQLPRCCNDDACDKQSAINCEVECGRQYMIQIGTRPGAPAFSGSFQIDCAGKPCDGGHEPIACDCTGERPPLVDDLTVPFNPGLVAAVTNTRPSPSDPAVVLFDLGNQGSAPLGSNWNAPRYAHPSWSMVNLGSVLGVTLDDSGNIFVGHTSSYPDFFGTGDAVGVGGAGAIYRLDGATGAVTTVLALPQQIDPNMPAAEPYPGLGQLSFDGATQRLFAANFEDGRVYSIDPNDGTGFKVKSTYRHGGTITGTLPDSGLANPNDPAGFESLGKRIFAVKATQGRLFYSVWSEDAGRQSIAISNEIWSVAFDANGVFQTGTARLEFALPSLPGQIYSNPVADITFDGECCMLVAERSFGNTISGSIPFPDTTTTAHDARTMRFCQDASGAWSPDIQFQVGSYSGTDSAGGIGFEGVADKVWMLADALSYPPGPWVYGLQGMPATGAPPSGSIWVDIDNNFVTYQKWQQGSLDVNCLAQKPCEFATEDIDCVPTADGGMDFLWTVTITNGQNAPPANLLILGDPVFAPNNVMVLNPPLEPGQSTTLNIPISGANPGDTFCFTATLAASFKDECCTEEICLTLPDCRCFDYDADVNTVAGSTGFTVNLAMVNLSQPAFAGEWVTVAVASGYAATVSPSLIDIPTTPYGASVSTGAITVSTALPAGSLIKLIVGLHSQSFHPCCFVEIDVFVPAQGGSTTPGDVNGDGTVDGADLALLLSGWGLAGATDLDGDGITGPADLAILLSNWS